MSDQKMQECFEFFYDLKWEQVNDFAQQAWKAAWLASRETMVIELPKEPGCPEDPEEAIDDSHMDAYHAAIRIRNACRYSIHAAGVKTK